MKAETMRGGAAGQSGVGMPQPGSGGTTADNVIRLASCAEFDWVVVRTCGGHVYDIVVLSGATGAVMVRGGRFFPDFRRATVVGSTFGGSAVKLRTICAGLHLELKVDGKSIVTSSVTEVSRRLPSDAVDRSAVIIAAHQPATS